MPSHQRGKGARKEGSGRHLAGKMILQSPSGGWAAVLISGGERGPREGETQADVLEWGRLQMSHLHLLRQKRLQSGITVCLFVCSFLHKHLLNAYYMPGIVHSRKTPSLVLTSAGQLCIPEEPPKHLCVHYILNGTANSHLERFWGVFLG